MPALSDDQSHLTPQDIERIAREQAEQARKFGQEGTDETYSHMGPKGTHANDQTARHEPDLDQGNEAEYEDVYGLAGPVAAPRDSGRQGSHKDLSGAERSQDEQGYQQ